MDDERARRLERFIWKPGDVTIIRKGRRPATDIKSGYLKPIHPPLCREPNCTKRATCTLYSGKNKRLGTYCGPHGRDALERLRKEA